MCKIWDDYYSDFNYNISQRIDYFNQQLYGVENIHMDKYRTLLKELFDFCEIIITNIYWHNNMNSSLQSSFNSILSYRRDWRLNKRSKNIEGINYLLIELNKFYKSYCDYLTEHFKCDKHNCLTDAIQYRFGHGVNILIVEDIKF